MSEKNNFGQPVFELNQQSWSNFGQINMKKCTLGILTKIFPQIIA